MTEMGRVMAEAVSRRRLTAEIRVQFLARPCGVLWWTKLQCDSSVVRWWSFVSVVPPVLHAHYFNCCRHYIILSVDNFCK